MTKIVIFVLFFFVAVALVQGLPAGLEQQPIQKEFKPPHSLVRENLKQDGESQETGDEEKDLSSSNTFGFGYYTYPRYYNSYYPSYYSGYRSYGWGGYGGYYSPYQQYRGWY